MTFYLEAKKLARFCRRCGGRCCIGGDVTISRGEMKRLKERYRFKTGVLRSAYGTINIIKNRRGEACRFLALKGKTRCILKQEIKPLSCRLFPLTFIMEHGKLQFYLSGFCPYAKEVADMKQWTGRTITEAEKDLEGWTRAERLCRSSCYKKYTNLIGL